MERFNRFFDKSRTMLLDDLIDDDSFCEVVIDEKILDLFEKGNNQVVCMKQFDLFDELIGGQDDVYNRLFEKQKKQQTQEINNFMRLHEELQIYANIQKFQVARNYGPIRQQNESSYNQQQIMDDSGEEEDESEEEMSQSCQPCDFFEPQTSTEINPNPIESHYNSLPQTQHSSNDIFSPYAQKQSQQTEDYHCETQMEIENHERYCLPPLEIKRRVIQG